MSKSKSFIRLRGGEIDDEVPSSDAGVKRAPKVLVKLPSDKPDQLFQRAQKYNRSAPKPIRIEDPKLAHKLKKVDHKAREARFSAAKAEILQVERAGFIQAEGLEKTYKFSQDQIKQNVDLASSRKIFDLKLETFGPYTVSYTRNGRQLLLGGSKGHLGSFDWKTGRLGCETHVKETVRDVTWLHNETLFAAAQKRYVYIYDNTGTEVNILPNHVDPLRLQFLPYHFLLASVGNAGYLKYHDTSVNRMVCELRTRLGPCYEMKQNPYNAVLHLGHTNGTVTLWSPNMATPLVKQFCHHGPLRSLAVESEGRYMATSGIDGQLKIWDIRNFKEEPVHAYSTPYAATSMDFSQRGLLAVAFGPHVQIWKDIYQEKQQSPYLNHHMPACPVHSVKFAPFEDVLGIGHKKGFSSILVPGAGEPNFDSYEANPFENKKQRKEGEVKSLLEKIPSELIALDPRAILKVDRASKQVIQAEKKELEMEQGISKSGPEDEKNRKRGRNKILKRLQRKQKNVIDEKKTKILETIAKEREEKARRDKAASKIAADGVPSALDRFEKKKKFKS